LITELLKTITEWELKGVPVIAKEENGTLIAEEY
jgi:hypothetical protein